MRTRRAFAAALLIPSFSFADDALMTTCFDDSGGPGAPLGVWTYEGYADWKSARAAVRTVFPGTLAFSFFPGRSDYSVPDLSYCFYMRRGDPTAPPIRCQSGVLHVLSLSESRELVGKYSFELQNGERKELEFTATYCPYVAR